MRDAEGEIQGCLSLNSPGSKRLRANHAPTRKGLMKDTITIYGRSRARSSSTQRPATRSLGRRVPQHRP